MTTLVNVRTFPLVDRRRILPPGVVYIGRAVPRVGLKASKYADPFKVGKREFIGQAEVESWAIPCYRTLLGKQLEDDSYWLEPLRGKTLACWCPPLICHGDVILNWLRSHGPLAQPGERIKFGMHRMPAEEAEAAEAWPSLNIVRWRADAKFQREQRKVRV